LLNSSTFAIQNLGAATVLFILPLIVASNKKQGATHYASEISKGFSEGCSKDCEVTIHRNDTIK